MASKSTKAPQRVNKGASRPNGLHVITLRIDASSKKKLHTIALKKAKELGHALSYNATILQLIADA